MKINETPAWRKCRAPGVPTTRRRYWVYGTVSGNPYIDRRITDSRVPSNAPKEVVWYEGDRYWIYEDVLLGWITSEGSIRDALFNEGYDAGYEAGLKAQDKD
jgi:hypothetical protein